MHLPASAAFIGAILCCSQAALAAKTEHCSSSSDGVCYRWARPESSSKSSSSDVYFQITAPDTYQWVALGIGSQMAGAQIFAIYQNGKGNVTLSTRSGTGHVVPQYSKRSDVELLEGSGVENSSMIANIKCSDCPKLDFSGSSSWIAAWKTGSSLDSTNLEADINQHDDYDIFNINMAKVATFSGGNPFIDATNSTSSDSSSNNSSDKSSDKSSDTSSDTSSDAVTESDGDKNDGTSKAHGLIMAVIFVLAYPLGAFLMPMLGKWIFHASWQTLAFIGMWIGFGLGYMASKSTGTWNNATHVKLGVAVCILMAAQPILGWAHHKYFVAHQQRGLISHVHIWYGRILMTLGIFNGGLGLRLAGAARGYIVAYSIVTISVAVLYFVGGTMLEMRRARRAKQSESYRMTGTQAFH